MERVFLPGGRPGQLLGVDYAAGEIVMVRSENRASEQKLFAVGLDGQPRGNPTVLPLGTLDGARRLGRDEWIGWGSVRMGERNAIAWALPSGSGSYELPPRVNLHSLSVGDNGRLVALSLYGALPELSDEIHVLELPEAKEILRIMPRGSSQPNAMFVGSQFFAYDARNAVRVLKIVP
ncbi:MAG TPA: hypothetical protein VEB21_03710 [Terriglobales bacterium]|nr:hypothetical protein [Terriglobales bacterium]